MAAQMPNLWYTFQESIIPEVTGLKRVLLPLLALTFLLAACGAEGSAESGAPSPTKDRPAVESAEVQFSPPSGHVSTATIETSAGDITVVLYHDYAPLAAENFLLLAKAGLYDGVEFSRVVEDFVIQSGSAGEGENQSYWGGTLPTEYSNYLHHYSGALCMAGADGRPDTHGSQFYIVATPAGNVSGENLETLRAAGLREEVVSTYAAAGGLPYLDYSDTVFGQVYAGMEVVDDIAAASTDENGAPQSPVLIRHIRVEDAAY